MVDPREVVVHRHVDGRRAGLERRLVRCGLGRVRGDGPGDRADRRVVRQRAAVADGDGEERRGPRAGGAGRAEADEATVDGLGQLGPRVGHGHVAAGELALVDDEARDARERCEPSVTVRRGREPASLR